MRIALACLAPSLFALAGCSADRAPEPAPFTGPETWNREVTPPSDGEAADTRTACGYGPGSLPAETQGASHPSGSEIPIDHILVVMMENRSFDHYFQKLPEYGQPDVDVAPDDFSNPDADGVAVPIFHQEAYCFVDTDHSWAGTARQIGDGSMDGFVVTNEGSHEQPASGNLEMFSGRRALGYYDHTDLPFYYWLASEFSIGDRYFSSLPGPTAPNRMYLYAATSFGHVQNLFPDDGETLVELLEKRKLSWKIYASSTPGMAIHITKLGLIESHVAPIEEYFEDAESGDLPAFAFVDPSIGLGTGQYDNDDEHPPALAQIGQAFVARVVEALTKSPAWSRSALFITYDEHGGLYDHVAPPPACPPDGLAPKLEPGDPDGAFDRLGVRVPFMVVSPYAKRHHVSHEVYDHTSIARFVEARYVLPALTHRDANALAPWDMFDFDSAPHLEPPAVEVPAIPAAELEACGAIF